MADEPQISENWGEDGLSAAERVYAWNTLEVLAMSSGNIEQPANAIPGVARAVLQLRFVVGTRYEKVVDAIRTYLHGNGFSMVDVSGQQRSAGRRTRSARPRARRRRSCRISAARCPTACSRKDSACRRSGFRIPIPAARSTRRTNTFCCRSPRKRWPSWRACSGISARCRANRSPGMVRVAE